MLRSLLIYCGAAMVSLPAAAAVVDQLRCSVTLYDAAGNSGPTSEAGVTGVRRPLPDSGWVPGVTGTEAFVSMNLEEPASKLEVQLMLSYEQYHSAQAQKASQYTCITYEYEIDGNGVGSGCAEPATTTPWDPTAILPATTLTSGMPDFRVADLTDQDVKFSAASSGGWVGFKTHCDFIGTIY